MKHGHYDAWGHPILGYFEMLEYFSKDKKSLSIVRHFPSHRYVCAPTIRMEIKYSEPDTLILYRVWPGGNERFCQEMNERAKSALRKMYVKPHGGWNVTKTALSVVFDRTGRLTPCGGGKSVFHARA